MSLREYNQMLQKHQASTVKKGPVRAEQLLKAFDFYWSKPALHHDQVHEKMLSLCNESIAFAPINSVELERAYTARSKLDSHLNLDKEPESLSDGFQGFTPSKNISCAAECVSIEKHLVANRNIKAQEIIMVEEGYAVLPKKEFTYLLCSQCLKVAWNAVPCSACPLVIYCSEHCKTIAWENYHQTECLILPSIHDEEDSMWNMSISITALRCFLTSIKHEGLVNVLRDARAIDEEKDRCLESLASKGSVSHKNFKSLYSLIIDEEDLNVDKINKSSEFLLEMLVQFSNVLDGCTELDKVKKILVKLSLIVEIYHLKYRGSICNSSHDVCSLDCDSIKGYFISTCSSLLNHSCTPNLGKIFMPDRKIVVFAACPIKKGEQLCITYGPALALVPNPKRIGLLHRERNLTCLCQACTEGWCPCDCLADNAGARSFENRHEKHIKYDLSLKLNDRRLALEEKLFDQYGEKYEIPDDCK